MMQTVGLIICFSIVIWYVDYRYKKMGQMVVEVKEATTEVVNSFLEYLDRLEITEKQQQYDHMNRIINLEAQINKQDKDLQKVVDILNNK